MCKSWSIKYSCSHTCRFRLSTCRGTFTTQARPSKEPKAACSTAPVLDFSSPSKCGLCERAHVEKQETEKVNSIRSKIALKSVARYEDELDFEEDVVPADNPELMAAIERQNWVSFQAYKLYPNPECKKFRVPEKGKRTTLMKGSRLRHEVVFTKDDYLENDAERWSGSSQDEDYYGGWADWTISSGRLAEIEQECKEWMESESEIAETDSTVPEWGSGAEETATASTLSTIAELDIQRNPMETVREDLSADFDIKEPQPSSINPTISTILATSTNSKLNISPPPTQPQTKTDSTDKENTSPSSKPATTIHSPPDLQNENSHPSVRYKFKAVPPHLRRRKSFIFNRQRSSSSSESTNVHGKAEADLAENLRCWNYSWVSVST